MDKTDFSPNHPSINPRGDFLVLLPFTNAGCSHSGTVAFSLDADSLEEANDFVDELATDERVLLRLLRTLSDHPWVDDADGDEHPLTNGGVYFHCFQVVWDSELAVVSARRVSSTEVPLPN